MKDYRKLYAEAYGIEWDTKKYEVHHMDFNHDNNDLDNLVLVPKTLHHQYHFTLETVKQNVKSLDDLWSVKTLDSYTSQRLEEFVKYRFLMSQFYKIKYYYSQIEEEKNITDIVRILLPYIYKEYNLGE